MVTAEAQRFWSKVEKTGGCWLWTANKFVGGYGSFRPTGSRGASPVRAHRWAYEHIVGPIPTGYQIDHLCRVRHCVNPEHLEPVTQAENIRRGIAGFVAGARQRAKTHCPQGHPYDSANTYVLGRRRVCRLCHRNNQRRYVAEKVKA